MVSTSDYSEAMAWTLELCGPLNVPRVWIPEIAFVSAVRDDNSLSFTRKTNDGFFGLGIGSNPVILPEWNEFALPQDLNQAVIDVLSPTFTPRHLWETHAILIKEQSYSIELLEVCAGLLGLSYDRGIERINLVVLSSNTPAISAYKKVGFQEIGKFVSYSR